MIVTIDIETRGLDATKFILGCLLTERCPNKAEIYYTKEELWKRVLELGYAEHKRGKTLTIYHHNAQYDTAGYIDWTDTHLQILSTKPFIINYQIDTLDKDNKVTKKTIIKFLDTLNIYRMTLEKAGTIIGISKLDTPIYLKQPERLPKKISKETLQEIAKYCEQDTKITMQLILRLKTKLKQYETFIKGNNQ